MMGVGPAAQREAVNRCAVCQQQLFRDPAKSSLQSALFKLQVIGSMCVQSAVHH